MGLSYNLKIKLVARSDAEAAGVEFSVEKASVYQPVAVTVRDAWVTKDLGDGWRASYRIVAQDGFPVIGELRIYPAERARRRARGAVRWPGEWSGELLGLAAKVPAGGLTTTIARRTNPAGDVKGGLYKALQDMEQPQPNFRQGLRTRGLQHSMAPPPKKVGRAGGRTGRPIAFYAKAAKRYVDLHLAGKPAIQALAMQLNCSEGVAKGIIERARLLGFLSRTKKGQQGGFLTASGKAALGREARNFVFDVPVLTRKPALQRIATASQTGGMKRAQVQSPTNKNARQSTGRTKRA